MELLSRKYRHLHNIQTPTGTPTSHLEMPTCSKLPRHSSAAAKNRISSHWFKEISQISRKNGIMNYYRLGFTWKEQNSSTKIVLWRHKIMRIHQFHWKGIHFAEIKRLLLWFYKRKRFHRKISALPEWQGTIDFIGGRLVFWLIRGTFLYRPFGAVLFIQWIMFYRGCAEMPWIFVLIFSQYSGVNDSIMEWDIM